MLTAAKKNNKRNAFLGLQTGLLNTVFYTLSINVKTEVWLCEFKTCLMATTAVRA